MLCLCQYQMSSKRRKISVGPRPHCCRVLPPLCTTNFSSPSPSGLSLLSVSDVLHANETHARVILQQACGRVTLTCGLMACMMNMQYLFASSSFDVRALASMYWDQGDYSEFLKFAHLGLQHKDPSSCTSVHLLYYYKRTNTHT